LWLFKYLEKIGWPQKGAEDTKKELLEFFKFYYLLILRFMCILWLFKYLEKIGWPQKGAEDTKKELLEFFKYYNLLILRFMCILWLLQSFKLCDLCAFCGYYNLLTFVLYVHFVAIPKFFYERAKPV
jgi:hypothetical protein